MKIGDRVFVHGYIDEIRKDTVIIRNNGGYFGTMPSEIITGLPSEDVQPVVRCRECIWLIRGDDRLFEDCVCDNAESPVFATDEDFGCIYGEQKGADE